jgi:XrtJ-associated TM-motif-TM protein
MANSCIPVQLWSGASQLLISRIRAQGFSLLREHQRATIISLRLKFCACKANWFPCEARARGLQKQGISQGIGGVQLRKYRTILPVALFLLLTTVRMHAQIDGCDESPENPTLILGLIVSAASVGYVQVRRFMRARNNPKDQ